jgi:oligopeptide transport system substrate-binding protein
MFERSKAAARSALALFVVLTTLALAACGGGGAGAPAGDATSPAGGAGNLAPADRQILRVQLTTEPSSIDPAQDQDTTQETVIQQLFSMLTRVDENLQPIPGVAESWEFNADNTQITFKLREATWSDGQPLTAQDFEYAWKRFVDPRTAAPYISLVTGVIKGATELSETPADDTAAIEQALANMGVRAVDDRTLQVDLEVPAPYFPSIASLGNLAPVRRDLVEQHGERWAEAGTLIGNGPFTLSSWTKGAEMTLGANQNYYEGAPTLQQLVFKFITDDATAFANYQAGELDLTAIPPSEIPTARDRFQNEVREGSQLSTYYYSFNVEQPPFDDVRVRQAIAYAIDRKAITDQIFNGLHRPASSFIPPGMPGHVTAEEAGDAAQTFDPEKAKALLAEAGFAGGQGFPPLTLAFNNNGSHGLIAQRVQSDLQTNLGIQVTLDPREPTTYFNEIQDNPPAFFRNGWNADYPDPVNWDRLVFGPGSSQNYGRWENSEFTSLLDQADQASDPDQRIDLYKQAEKVLAQDAGSAFIYWYGRIRLVKPYVSGLTVTAKDPELGAFHYKDVQILAQ